jgi:hypothetical protein
VTSNRSVPLLAVLVLTSHESALESTVIAPAASDEEAFGTHPVRASRVAAAPIVVMSAEAFTGLLGG